MRPRAVTGGPLREAWQGPGDPERAPSDTPGGAQGEAWAGGLTPRPLPSIRECRGGWGGEGGRMYCCYRYLALSLLLGIYDCCYCYI